MRIRIDYCAEHDRFGYDPDTGKCPGSIGKPSFCRMQQVIFEEVPSEGTNELPEGHWLRLYSRYVGSGGQRAGQALYNAWHEYMPEVALTVRVLDGLDPF